MYLVPGEEQDHRGLAGGLAGMVSPGLLSTEGEGVREGPRSGEGWTVMWVTA